MKKRKLNKGFTLVELVVTISLSALIIGAVSSIVYFSYKFINDVKRLNDISNNMDNFVGVISNYIDENSSLVIYEVNNVSTSDQTTLITCSSSSLFSKDNRLFINDELVYTSSYTLTFSIMHYKASLYRFSFSCEKIEKELIKSII